MSNNLALQVAASLHWLVAIGFGVFCFPAIWNVIHGKDIPFVFGFPAYGQGPFENYGIRTTVPLLVGFLLVCIFEIVAGILLWQGSILGAILAMILLPLGAVYWWGFDLPIPWICAIIWTILILLNWNILH